MLPRIRMLFLATALLAVICGIDRSAAAVDEADADGFVALFPTDGVPEGWSVRQWDDVAKSAEEAGNWHVKDGILHGPAERGNWLLSDEVYQDFELHFDFKLGERGNSGCALRAPGFGDPAFDGMELQMADLRYNPDAKPSELTGGIYRAIEPTKQVYRPTQWNRYEIKLVQRKLSVKLNGELILDIDLDDYDDAVLRHNGQRAPAVKDRPPKGHIGFQELSRGGVPVQIRGARIKVLK